MSNLLPNFTLVCEISILKNPSFKGSLKCKERGRKQETILCCAVLCGEDM